MDAIECIMTRRSIRKYKEQPVDNTIIDTILSAGANAPSAANQQPWHFIVITERGILNRIAEVHPYAKMLRQAPCAIAVCMDNEPKHYKDLAVDDCSAATQNMLLAANAKGLGSVWIGVHHSPERVNEIKNILNIPAHVTPFSIVSLGYPDEARTASPRLKPEMVHRDKW